MHYRARALGPWAVIVTYSATGPTTDFPGLRPPLAQEDSAAWSRPFRSPGVVLPGSIRTGGPEELYREGSSSAEIGQGDSIVTGP